MSNISSKNKRVLSSRFIYESDDDIPGNQQEVITISDSDDDISDAESLGSEDTVDIQLEQKIPDIRGSRWCFTYFGDDKPDFDDSWMTFLCFQLEQAPMTGRRHYQGFLITQGTVRLKRLLGWLPGSHFEKARGTNAQCRDYCRKEESAVPNTFEEFGRMPSGQGTRTDLLDFKDAILDGKTDMELLDSFPSQTIRYNKVISFVRRAPAVSRRDRPAPEVTWIFGPSGYGKSHLLNNLCDGSNYTCSILGGFFSPYNGEDNFLLDEFQLEGFPGGFKFFLRLLDKWPVSLNIKNGDCPMVSKNIIISTIEHPDFFVPSGQSGVQLDRRIHNIIEFVSFKKCKVLRWSGTLDFAAVAAGLGIDVE